jgi:ferredoxin
MVNIFGLLELIADIFGHSEQNVPLTFDKKRCINIIKSQKECSLCVDVCPTKAIDLNTFSIETSACTLCGACSLICPTNSFVININYKDTIKTLEPKEICIGCTKSNKAEVVLPCIANLNEKDILDISKNKKIYFDISPCDSCTYSFSKDIKNLISKAIYLSKVFRLNNVPSFVEEDYKPKFRHTSFKIKQKEEFSILNEENEEKVCSSEIPFEGKFGYIEISEGCDLCGACEAICPQKAIKIENAFINFSHGLCIACGLCEYACGLSHPLRPLTLKKVIIPSKYTKDYEPISVSHKRICENCGRIFYTKQEDQNLCIRCQKEKNLQNMILDLLK